MLVAAAWALATQIGGRRATGVVLAGSRRGARASSAPSSALIGLEAALTAWNDQMALLPWGLSRILGITVYLDMPADTAWYAAAAGAVLAIAGTALTLPWRRRDG